MATKKRIRSARVALTLTGEPLAACRDLAAAMDKPVATVIAEWLAELAPSMRDVAKIARQVRAGKHSAAKRTLQHMLGNAAAELVTQRNEELFKR